MAAEPREGAAPPPFRFNLKHCFAAMTGVCLLGACGGLYFYSVPLAIIALFFALQVPLMLLVNRRLARPSRDSDVPRDQGD